jgi:hypothetical protein
LNPAQFIKCPQNAKDISFTMLPMAIASKETKPSSAIPLEWLGGGGPVKQIRMMVATVAHPLIRQTWMIVDDDDKGRNS